MIIIYRISNNSNKKPRLANATKEECLKNFCHHMLTAKDFLIVIADNVDNELSAFLNSFLPANSKVFYVNTGSGAASFKMQIDLTKKLPTKETVFFSRR